LAFHCDIVTPDHEVFKESVSSVVLPAHDGYLGILTNRAPLLVRLGAGTLTATLARGGATAFEVRGGVAQMKDNHLTVLTEAATPAAAG
jgi:F-type H+-transporting ATPase subunit epsilon